MLLSETFALLVLSDWHHSDACCSTWWQRGHREAIVELWSVATHNNCGKQYK